MKKVKTVKIPAKKAVAAKPAKTKEVEETVCDFCGANVPDHGSYGWYPSCSGCGRDCCRKHNFAEDSYTDYPEWYCSICLEIRKNHEGDMKEIESSYHEELERLEQQMREESLARDNN